MHDTNEAIETAASALADIREQRKELAAREKDAEESLRLEMKRAGITFYVAAGGIKCDLDVTERVKTKRIGGYRPHEPLYKVGDGDGTFHGVK